MVTDHSRSTTSSGAVTSREDPVEASSAEAEFEGWSAATRFRATSTDGVAEPEEVSC